MIVRPKHIAVLGAAALLAACAETASQDQRSQFNVPVAAPPATRAIESEIQRFTIYFTSNSTRLPGDAQAVLDDVAAKYRGTTSRSVLIIGHADRAGAESYNMRLSQRRAETVRNALVQRGVARDAIRIQAVGEGQQLVATADGQHEPRNRAATITVQSGTPGV
jgi:outer membrane protein OmpA-like peptidoglycan-associated protein